MVAQAIFPYETGGASSRERAPQGKSDAFETMLRDYEARGNDKGGETARSDASRDRAEHDAELSAKAWREFDAAQDARDINRNRDTSDEPPLANNFQAAGENPAQSGRTDETRPSAERPGQNGQAATPQATAPQADTLGSGNLTKNGAAPAGTGLDGKGAPNVVADPALAGKPALGATPSKQSAPAVTAPTIAVTAGRDAVGPKIPLNTAANPAVPGETANANVAAPAAAKEIISTLPAAAEAAAPLTASQVERTQASGVPASGSEAQAAVGFPVKGAQTPATVKTQTDRAGNKSPASASPAATVKVPELQAEAKQAAPTNPAPVNPSPQNPGQRTAKTGDTVADLFTAAAKAATPAGTAAQTPASPAGFDPMQLTARAAAAPPAIAPATDRPVPPSEVAVNIQRAVARGENRIRIQLHPAELGQVDVRLKIGADGIVRAMVQVDRPETLDLMQRDVRGLERALQDAGLKTDSGSLNFNLRDRGEDGPQDRRDGKETAMAGREESDTNSSGNAETAEIAARTFGSNRVLDMRV